MKAAVLTTYDTSLSRRDFVIYQDVPEPKITGPARYNRTRRRRWSMQNRSSRDRRPLARPGVGHSPVHNGPREAGWVEAIGGAVETVKVGDPVICHPLVSKGEALAARRGNDMHAGGKFPGNRFQRRLCRTVEDLRARGNQVAADARTRKMSHPMRTRASLLIMRRRKRRGICSPATML